ncbi:hypothetical protein F5Y01DRAFT_309783 [Xylaria sp. FL0043]|nr:hypothetical protein F5Y01DRAFT_309783 [Xylaria sp. FL0043]
MHGRRVDIAEYEHRWMHERGACGCEVQFPGLHQPRLVKRSSFAEDERAVTPTTKAGASSGPSAGGSALSEQKGVSTTDYNADNAHITNPDVSRQGEGSSVPLYTEARVGDHVEVAVRLTSLYGAEWTKDHAKLHDSGKCKCPVSFERYKPLNIDDDEGEDENTGLDPTYLPEQVRKISRSYGSDAATSSKDQNSAAAAGPHFPSGYDHIPTGDIARWAVDGPQSSLLDQILGPVGPDALKYGNRPVDIQTMHYPRPGLPISGNPIGYETFQGSGLPTTVEYEQPERTLAGFPIGAGPEGESHAGNFEDCSLQSSLGGSPVRRRRLSSEF